MRTARLVITAAAAALCLTATYEQASARALDHFKPLVGRWPASTGDIATGSSPAPTVAEWNNAPEVGVTKSSAYHCETKLVREWFRSSCVAYDKWTLAPAKTIAGPPSGDQILFWTDPGGAKASVVLQVRAGRKYVIQFNWNPGPTPSNLNIDLTGGTPLAWFG